MGQRKGNNSQKRVQTLVCGARSAYLARAFPPSGSISRPRKIHQGRSVGRGGGKGGRAVGNALVPVPPGDCNRPLGEPLPWTLTTACHALDLNVEMWQETHSMEDAPTSMCAF